LVVTAKIAALSFLGTLPVLAQMNTAEITGRVMDALGGGIPGASITADQGQTGQKFTTLSNNSGQYVLAQLPIGVYSLKVGARSFKQAVLSNIQLHLGDSLRQDFALEIGDASETVVVEADAGGVQPESAEIKDVIQRRQIIALPLKTRQFLDLAMLSEGVVRPPGGTRGDAMQQAGTLVNVLGQRSGHNLYLIDGATVTDEHFNNMVIAPSIEAISEFNIQKTSYAPEFGGKSGAVINVVTRSGSNELHGSLFEFARNDIFDAKNFFDSPGAPIPPFRQNQFGGSLGGPVIRNRTFFFVSYEGQRVRKPLTQTFSVPTMAMRSGDFSGSPPIYDPSTDATGTRQPFPESRIPVQSLDPVATALLANVPLPNLAGVAQNLLATASQRIDTNNYSARLDHQFSTSDNAYARFSLFDAREFDPFGSGVLQESLLPGFGRNLSTHALNGVIGSTHIFTPFWLNEARFAFLTVVGGQTSPNARNPFTSLTGLEGVTTNPQDMGFPQFSFGGQFTTMGDPALFTYRDNRDFELADNVNYHPGSHAIKFGAYFMHFDFRPVNPNGARGIFSFTPRFTSSAAGLGDGSAFADFLLGYPTTAQVGLGRAALDAHTNWAHLYAEDSWQITGRFKVDAGLRYEYNQNMTDAGNQMAAIDTLVPGGRFVIASSAAGAISPAGKALLSFLPVSYVTSAAAGWNNSLLVSRPVRLAPRAGFAWTLPGNGKTVLRGGFGIYPNQAAYSIVSNFAQNLPFFVTKTVNSSASGPPAFRTENALALNTLGTVGGSNLDHDLKIEYNEVWNVNLERELTQGSMLSVAYIGSRTVHADSSTVLNVPLPGPGDIAARRPIPQLSQLSDIRWNGWAAYHALTLSVKRRFARGLAFDANWTWSHSIDDASDPGATLNETNLPQNVYNLGAEKATSSFDHRQRAVVSFVYQIPLPAAAGGLLGNRWVRAALRQWQVGGNLTAQSGAPFTVNLANDQANIGAGPAQRPNVVGDPNRGSKRPGEWFNTAAFSLPALYRFGDAPRNAVIGPGLGEVDFSLQKEMTVKEPVRVQFRAEAYNLANTANLNIPNRTAFTANFGRVSSAQDARQLQFALKLVF
jgi:hypothetical protein